VAKKVFPVHLDVKDRRIVDALAERDGVSRAEAIRRIIRSFQISVVSPADAGHAPVVADAAAH
jgi:LmbE family N-acetylglucosaminyl deacetylase